MFSLLSIVKDLLWFQRSKIIQTQRVLCIGVFHFAAKRNPFCGKTQPILRQNATHFAAKRVSELQKLEFVILHL